MILEKSKLLHSLLRYVKLLDNPIEGNESLDIENKEEDNQDREQFEKEFMKSYIKDLVERGKVHKICMYLAVHFQLFLFKSGAVKKLH